MTDEAHNDPPDPALAVMREALERALAPNIVPGSVRVQAHRDEPAEGRTYRHVRFTITAARIDDGEVRFTVKP
jgi:hypothetical protein